MAQVLSQDEVDALLTAVNDGDSDDSGGGGGGGGDLDDDFLDGEEDFEEEDENIQAYDLTNQQIISQPSLENLKKTHF